jgi:4-alpha-glucanotransferase
VERPAHAAADPAVLDTLLLRDTWCSAGTVDYAFETNAFKAVLPARGNFSAATVQANANHTFQLRMAAVPAGLLPCLIGSVSGTRRLGMASCGAAARGRRQRLAGHASICRTTGGSNTNTGFMIPSSAAPSALEQAKTARWKPRLRGRQHGRWSAMNATAATPRNSTAPPVWPSRCFRCAGEKSLGVGEFADLKPLADWAQAVGLKLIQILPINDTTSSHDWTDSYPYSAISVFALHPIYLRIET